MPARPRDIGTAAETAVVRYLRTAGWPHAERRALRGTHDCGDITGTPGIAWEVKGGQAAKCASDGQVAQWLADTDRERRNAAADIGVLVMARAGIGAANADRWWAVMPFSAAANLTASNEAANWWLDRAAAASIAPVRMHLSTACALLRVAGFGTTSHHLEQAPA